MVVSQGLPIIEVTIEKIRNKEKGTLSCSVRNWTREQQVINSFNSL